MGFEQTSYEKHSSGYAGLKEDAAELAFYRNWFDNHSVDLQRHLDMLSILDPFLEVYPSAHWITVADGRFGTSATYIEKKGGKALATDIDDSLLKIAAEQGMIQDFLKCNAEAMDFENDSFDFSYCKQAYHHFPRPTLALYEMLRISRKAVLFTEPADWVPLPVFGRILQLIKHFLKRLFRLPVSHTDTGNYESQDGNYIFTISEREMEKITLALNLPAVAYKRIHDIYIPGVEHERFSENGPFLKTIQRKQALYRIKRLLGLQRTNTIQYIIFKELPPEELVRKLKSKKYTFLPLPRNPFV